MTCHLQQCVLLLHFWILMLYFLGDAMQTVSCPLRGSRPNADVPRPGPD